MNGITIKYSTSDTSEELIYDLMDIEADVFEPEYRGEYESILHRFHKFQEMFVLAYDEGKLIGYLCFFPISDGLYDEIRIMNTFHDDDIKPDDIMDWRERNHIYLLSVAVYRAYQGKGVGAMLMNAFLDKVKEHSRNGSFSQEILASVVSEQGEKLVKEYDFVLYRDMTAEKGFQLYGREMAYEKF